MKNFFILVSISLFVLGGILFEFGIYTFSSYNKAIENYAQEINQHAPGSSVPYPCCQDTAWYFFEGGSACIVVGILILILRKRK